MAFDEAFGGDPNDELALTMLLGGSPPLSPVVSLDEKLKRTRLEQLATAAAKRAETQAKAVEQQTKANEPKPPKPPTMSVTFKGPLGSVPDPRDMPSGPIEPMPLTPVPPKAPAAVMRAATPEERVVGDLEEAGDPMNAFAARTQFAKTPNQPETAQTSMRAATTGERVGQGFSDLLNKLKPAWMQAEAAQTPTTPEPFHITLDPTIGSAAPEAAAGEAIEGVVGKLLKGGKAPKTPKPPVWEKAPVDEIATARMAMFGDTTKKVQYNKLPKQARPQQVHDEILAKDGITVQPATGQQVISGEGGPAMVGVFPNQTPRTMRFSAEEFSPKSVKEFYEVNRDVLAKDKNAEAFVGGWRDKTTGDIFLDISEGHLTKQGAPDIRSATKAGEVQDPTRLRRKPTGFTQERDPITGAWPKPQEAIHDPRFKPEEEGAFPPIGNLYEFLQSDEFRSRVQEMAEIGRKAMGGENPEWWNIVNGPMARVYGKENVEALAGYIASTSPQNGPVANMKMASELMRRHLKDQPVRQPDWRAPADAMGKVDLATGERVLGTSGENKGKFVSEGFAPSAGQKFPNLGTYAANAEKVQAGAPETVTDDKVNDMFRALMGKLVGVFDRHWAKIAEKPEAGIYADAVQNRLAGSMTSGQIEAYPVIENRVRDLAKQAGVDVSKYSAWVWEGIRDTIRNTGQLFGQQHRASAVPETTTGFNEIFEQLVDAKAKHLGISVGEFEKRLRNGDAELLTLLLATPVGAAAYAKWQGQTAGQPPRRADGGT
jgi:hypothetical protein